MNAIPGAWRAMVRSVVGAALAVLCLTVLCGCGQVFEDGQELDIRTVGKAVGVGAAVLGLLALAGRYLVGRVGVGPLSRELDWLEEVAMGSDLPPRPVVDAAAGQWHGAIMARQGPPDGVRPNEAALLASGRPGKNDLGALLLDLARRRVVALTPIEEPDMRSAGAGAGAGAAGAGAAGAGGVADAVVADGDALHTQPAAVLGGWAWGWELARLEEPAGFLPTGAERAVLRTLLPGSGAFRLDNPSGREGLRKAAAKARRAAIRDVAKKRWFRPGFRVSQQVYYMVFFALLTGFLAFAVASVDALPVVVEAAMTAVGGGAVGVLLLACALRAPTPRTPLGAGLFGELQQLKAYVLDVCAGDRLPRGSDADIAPWAIAFGLAQPFFEATKPIADYDREAVGSYPWWLFTAAGAGIVRACASSSSGESSDGSNARGQD